LSEQGIAMTNAGTPDATPWWALYTRHQHEKHVAEMLETKGYEVFLPLYESVRRWKDRSKVLSLPLFPGYVFVRRCFERRLGIVSTAGVHMMLSRGEAIAEIPDGEIEAIRRSMNAKLPVEPHPFLNRGDRVRVIRGALDGVEGILVRKKNIFRLVLSVEMLAQSACVEINAADVELVSSAGAANGALKREEPRPAVPKWREDRAGSPAGIWIDRRLVRQKEGPWISGRAR
jgi:transcription termination/antitermination protein NusG